MRPMRLNADLFPFISSLLYSRFPFPTRYFSSEMNALNLRFPTGCCMRRLTYPHYPESPRISTDTTELREAVANLYNVNYREGKESKYTYENVCIVPGGRSGLSRVAAVISNVYCVSVFSFALTHLSLVTEYKNGVLTSS